ncbi:MAG: type I 3-dehydroquinate dehydratase, partial [Syntrophales bacterium]|nr:type I 3-dehydroquinate dehydratase [Syntrophales bacterium]
AATSREMRAALTKAFAVADVVELRIAGLKDPALAELIREKRGPVLVTIRRREEGGAFDGPEELRVRLLENAVTLGADYVDLEASTEPALIARLKEHIEACSSRTNLILSWHDFAGTPSAGRLRSRFLEMATIGADIVKMVPYARRHEDSLRVLDLISYAGRKGQKIIAFCMGPSGRLSRVISPMLGACMTFVSLDHGLESAPGQLTIDEMKLMWKLMAS